MKSKQMQVLEMRHNTNLSQRAIAEKLETTENYVSNIIAKARMTRIPLKFKNGSLICSKCNNEYNNLMFHHNHSTGEYIALVCRSCNVKFKANNDFEYIKDYPVVIHSRIDHETKDRLDKVCKVKKWQLSTLIRIILEEYTA